MIVKISKITKNIALRVSKYDGEDHLETFYGKVKWVWLDTFDGLPKQKIIKKIKKLGFKICLVSPELHGNKINDNNIRNFLKLSNNMIDMVCTKSFYFKNWL